MADIQAFMTGFLGARAQKMQADQAKADESEERLRNIALRNQQIAMNRDALSNAAKGMGDQLLSWGATSDQIQAALKSGQTGLASLYKTVKGVKDTLGEDETKRFLGTVNADIGAAAAVGQEGLGDLYRQTFGLPMGTKVGDYKAPQESTLAKLFGATDRKAKMLENLDAELSGVGGYSVYDLTTIGTLPDYLPGSAGESISYKQPTIYSSANFGEEADFVDTRLKDLAQNPEYKFAQEEYNAAAKDLANTKAAVGSDLYNKTKERLDTAKAKITSMQDTAIKQSVLTQASQYFNDEDYLQAIKGHISTAYGFVPSWFEEEEEAAKIATEITNQSLGGGLTGTPPAGTDPEATPEGLTVKRTITTPQGSQVKIAEVDGKEVVLSAAGTALPEQESQMVLDAIYEEQPFDMPEAFVEGYNIPEKTVEERVAEKRESVGNVRQQIVEGYVAADEALGQAFAELDRSVASGMLTANEKMNTLFGAAAQMVGADDTADFFYEAAINSEDKAEDIEGLIPAINNLLDAWGVPDLTRDTPPAVALDSAMESLSAVMADTTEMTLDALPEIPISDEDAAAAAARAPAHVEKLGEQAMDAWRKLTAEVKEFKMSDVDVDFVTADEDNPMLKLITTLVGEETPKEKVVEYANVFTRATDTPASKQLQQLIVDQLDIADKEAKKIVVESKKATPEAAVDSFVQRMDASQATPSQQEIADLKTMLELHQIILPSRPAYTPPAGDVAKAFRKSEADSYGARGLPQQGEVLPSNLDAQQAIDTPPALDADGLPELPRNMTVESMLTRRDRGAGLMKRPSVDSAPVKPEMAGSELVALRSTLQRVHGKKSKAIKELDKIVQQAQGGIPIQYTDINRLLRMTKSLRKSETRDKLIEQLAILANEARK